MFSDAVDEWRRELQAAADVDICSIEISLSDLEDRDLRERVLAIPTAFRISPEVLQLLRRAGQSSAAPSRELSRFLDSTPRMPD